MLTYQLAVDIPDSEVNLQLYARDSFGAEENISTLEFSI